MDKPVEEMTTEELVEFVEEHIGCYELADIEAGHKAVQELGQRAIKAAEE